jgi:hypothetical protein
MAQSIVTQPRAIMSALASEFEIKDEQAIQAFLERYPDVPPLLIEIRSAIRSYFGDDPVIFYDPEWEEGDPDPALFANILTTSDDALARLKRFDREWWLAKLKETKAPLVVSSHHVGRV